ncbi:putative OCIA domain-containing protein 1 [Hypsibius exemplaris]|uniref:OCIA domain-containing protein 1 n=1 Tax=Hypsibius exemplaris TaxID=2072580 RepID=A0A1W0X4C6_HYPEX|nr:putative OCIA domain-containing protein 1 [Hypsibius exemplaris]
MSSPFGGPGGGGNSNPNSNSSDTYRSSLGYDRSPSGSPSGYSGSSSGLGGAAAGRNSSRTPENYDTLSGQLVTDPAPGMGYADTTGMDMPMGKDYKFSAEEMRVVKECTQESLYYRSLPLAAVGGVLTHLAVKQGYLQAHPKYGSLPKVIGMAVTGFFVGKMSYFRACQEKFLRLPNSPVGDAIRKRQGGQASPPRVQQPSWNTPLDLGSPKIYEGAYPAAGRDTRFDPQVGQSRSAGEQYSAMNTDDYHNTLDIDSEKNSYYDDSSLDERRPNSLDFDLGSNPGVGFGSQSNNSNRTDDRQTGGANYDDLRRQHRDAYLRPQQKSSQQRPE